VRILWEECNTIFKSDSPDLFNSPNFRILGVFAASKAHGCSGRGVSRHHRGRGAQALGCGRSASVTDADTCLGIQRIKHRGEVHTRTRAEGAPTSVISGEKIIS